MPAPRLPEVVVFDISVDDAEGEYRMCDGEGHFKYIVISTDVYSIRTMCEAASLVAALPPFPKGDWNTGTIGKDEKTGEPYFKSTSKVELPVITTWHPRLVDFLDLELGEMLHTKCYEATDKTTGASVVVKYARFPWEAEDLVAETEAYSWLKGTNIGPKFLGHIVEEGRAMGIMLERLEGARHATPEDLPACLEALSHLHDRGIKHGDINRHNFLVVGQRVVLIDFETAVRCSDPDVLRTEMEKVDEALRSTSHAGGMYTWEGPPPW